jgi:hypothetical protein
MNGMIRQVIWMLVDGAIGLFANRKVDPSDPDAKHQQQRNKQTAKRARQSMRILLRFTRF